MRGFKIARVFSLAVFVGLVLAWTASYAADPLPGECLGQTMECTWDTALDQNGSPKDPLYLLASELSYNAVDIYNWVYEDIEFQNYPHSRKGAQCTYLTKSGNEWDTASLLITLLRISGISARYVRIGDGDNVYVEAYLPISNYRGLDNYTPAVLGHQEMGWVPLVAYVKEYRVQDGIDLFPGTIPAQLNFDLNYLKNNYLNSEKDKTALEVFEEVIQKYLDTHNPGKTLKDVPYKKTIVKGPADILPATLPKTLSTSGTKTRFAEISNADRAQITLFFKKQSDKTVLLQRTMYLPEVAGKRFCLDWVPASYTDAFKISSYGSIGSTPPNVAQVQPVLKIDGVVIDRGTTLFTGQEFFPAFQTPSQQQDCPPRKAGIFMQIGLDPLSASEKTIEKMKRELKDISTDVGYKQCPSPLEMLQPYSYWLPYWPTGEAYLGRVGNILVTEYGCRNHAAECRTAELLYCRVEWNDDTAPTFIYTMPSALKSDEESKFLVHPQWNIDAYGQHCSLPKADGSQRAEDLGKLFDRLAGFVGSYNESLLFEDWVDTPAISTVSGIMLANKTGIPVLTIDKNNLTASLPQLKLNQSVIDRISDDVVIKGNTVVMPTQPLNYEGMTGYVYISVGAADTGYYLGLDRGGQAADHVDQDVTLATQSTSSINAWFPTGGADIYAETLADPQQCIAYYGETTQEKNTAEAVTITGGDPVDLVTGEFYSEEKPDIFYKSRGFNLEVRRKYKSRLIYNGPFGYGWTWNHGERLLVRSNGDIVYYNNECVPYYLTWTGSAYQYPLGTTFTLTKPGYTYEYTYVLTQKSGVKYYFSSVGLLTKKEDPYGNALTFEYSGTRLTAMRDSTGRALTFACNSSGKITSVSDWNSRWCNYLYDGDDLAGVVDLEQHTTSYEYLRDQENVLNDHNMSRHILPNGDFLDVGYYKNDQVAYHTNSRGDTFNFQYSRLNRYAETWNEEGYYRKVFFNENNDVIRIDNEDKTLDLNEYDANHNLKAHTDANGNTTRLTYDAKRNLKSQENALGEKWLFNYDPTFNKPTYITDPKGNVTVCQYDSKGYLFNKRDALGNQTIYTPDQFGNTTQVTDAFGNVTKNEYDAYGNLFNTRDQSGNWTTYRYDRFGNMVQSGDGKNNINRIDYNNYNQPTRVFDRLGRVTQYEYDENGRLTKITEPNGAETRYCYPYVFSGAWPIGNGDKPVQIIDPLGNSEYLEYDAVGNMISKTDKNGNVTRCAYDGLNRLVEEIDPYQHSIFYT